MSSTLDTPWRTASTAPGPSGSRLDLAAERAAAIGVGLLIVTGFASSYTTLRDLAADVGGFSSWLAPVVPLSFDVGIVVLSLKVVLAARAGRDARVLRALVLALSTATVVANGAASSTVVGRLLHAVPPAMFVVCFETLAASARHDAHARRLAARGGAAEDVALLPVLTTARWLLAPRETWSIWRSRVLGIASPHFSPSTSDTTERAVVAVAQEQPAPRRSPQPPVDHSDHRPRTPSGPPRADTTATAGQADHRGRLAVAVDALRADPDMTAVALAIHLTDAGHPVSVRTAQRIRHQAAQHIETGAADVEVPDDDKLFPTPSGEGARR